MTLPIYVEIWTERTSEISRKAVKIQKYKNLKRHEATNAT